MPELHALLQVNHLNTPSSLVEQPTVIAQQLSAISSHQEHLKQIKINIEQLIKAFSTPTSLFARAAHQWGKLNGWYKVIIAMFVLIPLLITAILSHITWLLGLSFIISTAYTTSSLLLDNHYHQQQQEQKQLQQGLGSLMTLFVTVIRALDDLREQLTSLIKQFQAENEYLACEVAQLSIKVKGLTLEISTLAELSTKLAITELALEDTAAQLTNVLNDQLALNTQYALHVNQISLAAQHQEEELTAQLTQLTTTNNELNGRLDRVSNIADALRNTVSTLANTVILDANQYQLFQQRLDYLITNHELTFYDFSQQALTTAKQLHTVNQGIADNNDDYKKLLTQQRIQITRLEKMLDNKEDQAQTALRTLSLFANPPKLSVLEQESISHIRYQLKQQVAVI